MLLQFSPSARVRRSPFYRSTIADGVVSFSTYNSMLMPTGYGDPIGEYWRLINGVAMWDVGQVTAQTWSPRMKRTIGLCLVTRTAKAGDAVRVFAPDGQQVEGELTDLPFI